IITALDPGGYGPLTIIGTITIEGNGWAAITAPSGDTGGIAVNAGPFDKIILRGLTLDGAGGPGATGHVVNAGGLLVVDGCVARNMAFNGLTFLSGVSSAQTLAVSNSQFVGNGIAGIVIEADSSGAIATSIDHTELNGNIEGLFVNGTNGTGP